MLARISTSIGVAIAAVVAGLVFSPTLQAELAYLHRVNWPRGVFDAPAAHQLPNWPRTARFLGLHEGFANATAHWLDGDAGRIGVWRVPSRCEASAGLLLYTVAPKSPVSDDPHPRTIHVPAAAPPRPASTDYPRPRRGAARPASTDYPRRYYHGNAENRADQRAGRKVRILTRRCLDVVVMDYRGFGDSGGYPSESGIVDDAALVPSTA